MQEIPLKQAVRRYQPNYLLRLLRFKRRNHLDMEFAWGTFNKHYGGLKFNLIQFSNDHDVARPWCLSLLLFWGLIFIELPFKVKGFPDKRNATDHQRGIRHWGFCWYWGGPDADSARFLVEWKNWSYAIRLPWEMVRVRQQCLSWNGSWINDPGYSSAGIEQRQAFDAAIARESHPYTYLMRMGTVQHVIATISVEECEWRCRGWKRFAWFNRVRRTINVHFESEVGEGVETWKGGAIACMFEMDYNETPEQTLRRMEATRRF